MVTAQCIVKCVRSLCRWFLFRRLTRHWLRSLTEVKTEQVSCHMKTSHTPVCSSASWMLEACVSFKALPIPPHKLRDKDRRGLAVGAKYKQGKKC